MILCDKCNKAIPHLPPFVACVSCEIVCGAGAAFHTKEGAKIDRMTFDFCDECAAEMFGFKLELAPQRAAAKKTNPISAETAAALAAAYR